MSIYLYGRHDNRKLNVTIYIYIYAYHVQKVKFVSYILCLIFSLDVKEGVYNFEEGEVNQV